MTRRVSCVHLVDGHVSRVRIRKPPYSRSDSPIPPLFPRRRFRLRASDVNLTRRFSLLHLVSLIVVYSRAARAPPRGTTERLHPAGTSHRGARNRERQAITVARALRNARRQAEESGYSGSTRRECEGSTVARFARRLPLPMQRMPAGEGRRRAPAERGGQARERPTGRLRDSRPREIIPRRVNAKGRVREKRMRRRRDLPPRVAEEGKHQYVRTCRPVRALGLVFRKTSTHAHTRTHLWRAERETGTKEGEQQRGGKEERVWRVASFST